MAIDRNTLVKNGQLESDLPEMYDDEVYDESNFHWNILILRVFCIALLICSGVFIALGATRDPTWYIISILLAMATVIFLLFSFFKFDCATSTITRRFGRPTERSIRHASRDRSMRSTAGLFFSSEVPSPVSGFDSKA